MSDVNVGRWLRVYSFEWTEEGYEVESSERAYRYAGTVFVEPDINVHIVRLNVYSEGTLLRECEGHSMVLSSYEWSVIFIVKVQFSIKAQSRQCIQTIR